MQIDGIKSYRMTDKESQMFIMNDINKICIVDKPYTEDDVIQLCNAIEHNSWTNLDTMTQFENGVIKIDESRI